MAPSKHLTAVVAEGGSTVVKEVDVPKLGPGQILVKVVAAAQNPTDCECLDFQKSKNTCSLMFYVHFSQGRQLCGASDTALSQGATSLESSKNWVPMCRRA